MIECENGALYTGYTTDIERRYQEHQQGNAKCRYTRSFKPIRLAAFWQYPSKSSALRAEKKIKRLTRLAKIQLLNQNQPPFLAK